MQAIYLDYNATTPIDPEVARAMLPFLYGGFGNPSSSHAYGAEARRAVEQARGRVAFLLGCRPEEIIFTSGGSEANNLALKGAALARRGRGNHVVTSSIEHPAVLEVCAWLESQGFRVSYLAVDGQGLVDPAALEKELKSDTILVSIMLANNEVGSIQPVAEIAAICRRRGIWVHTDAAQAVGKLSVRVDELGVDLLSLAGHKLYAPKGIGALYVGPGVRLEKLMHGAGHEAGRRAGTENVLEIVGLGAACELAGLKLVEYAGRMREMRDRLEAGLRARFPEMRVNGPSAHRLVNTLSASFPGLDATTILAALDGVAASAGAACHADRVEVSHVLSAMAVPEEYARGTIRFSVGRETRPEEIDRAIDEIERVLRRLRPDSASSPVPGMGGEIRLTRFTRGLGCACKLPAGPLERALAALPRPADPAVLVGPHGSDDAAVLRLDETSALVQTVDFFTPVVDDPRDFGRVAAANSLSDVYAMGGRPRWALAVVGFPAARLPLLALSAMLAGAAEKAAEAGVEIVGGHTIDSPEPFLGLAVTGFVRPERAMRNRGGRPGDLLVLTKPLGTGILATALKQGLLDAAEERGLVEHMAGLNKAAAEAMQAVGAHAATDVTGFGLLGHLLEMLAGEGKQALTAHLRAEDVPLLPRVRELAAAGLVPGGSRANLQHVLPSVRFSDQVSEVMRLVLADAQTSGGLLVALDPAAAGKYLAALRERGVAAAVIGELVEGGKVKIEIE